MDEHRELGPARTVDANAPDREALEEEADAAAFDAAIAEEGRDLSWTQAQAELGWDEPGADASRDVHDVP